MVNLRVLPADFPSRIAKVARVGTTDSLEQIITDFSDIVTDELPPTPMFGEPMIIELDTSKNIMPRKVTTCKQLPVHWETEANRLIAQLLKDGIIEEVHEDTCNWVSFLRP